jgi:hypothetical protein
MRCRCENFAEKPKPNQPLAPHSHRHWHPSSTCDEKLRPWKAELTRALANLRGTLSYCSSFLEPAI